MNAATTDLNLNQAQCIQSASHFGYTVFTNICSGAVHTVQWGGVDWTLCIGGIVMAAAFVSAMAACMLVMIFDW